MKKQDFSLQKELWFPILSFSLLIYGCWNDYHNFSILSIQEYLKLFISLGSGICGIRFIILEIQQKPSMFVVSIIGSCFSITYLFLWSPLIWDLLISVSYLVLSIYGLYHWGGENRSINYDRQIRTQSLSFCEKTRYTVICVIGVLVLSLIGMRISKYTSYQQAIADATTTSCGILGQWFLSNKIIETWYLWIIINTISIFLYISINSYTYAMLYLCYLIASFIGLSSWKKTINHSVTITNSSSCTFE